MAPFSPFSAVSFVNGWFVNGQMMDVHFITVATLSRLSQSGVVVTYNVQHVQTVRDVSGRVALQVTAYEHDDCNTKSHKNGNGDG